MALVAEAAGRLGGPDAFWKMHQWLLDHQGQFTETAARQAAVALGLDPGKLAAEIDSKAVREAVDGDIAAGAAAGIQGRRASSSASGSCPARNPRLP